MERIRLWTLFPEWTDFPISCKDVISAGRLQTTTEPPKKKSWFSRFKDSVRSTFGRSGGDSVEEYDDDDDDKNKDDHGRALHPHIATSESTHRSGDESRSSLSSRGSQSRSISGSSYGETSYGTGYGYGQSHYGSEYDQSTGFSQTSNGDKDYDWEQKPGSHFTSQTTGRGQDHHGGSGGGYDFDRLKGKKAAVSILKFKDESKYSTSKSPSNSQLEKKNLNYK